MPPADHTGSTALTNEETVPSPAPTIPSLPHEDYITSSNTPSSSTTDPISRQVQIRTEANQLRSQLFALQEELATSGEEIRQMTAYIHMLEAHLDSDWARGLTNEPPPLYHEVVSLLSRSS
ncbi:hypothetical protein VKT23_016877 [Stygiomarasmius scandens]|uniref:BZIP transcription factor n=1 Tax=Marasmiellus scandens TaxID=2682957 RepID=A0ABR1ITM6_9AGAR